MILNIWDSIRNFFINLFSNFSWGSVFFIFSGIIIGFLLSALIIVLSYTVSSKKARKKDLEFTEACKDDIVKNEEVNALIRGAKDKFKEEARDYTLGQKIESLKKSVKPLVEGIAVIYYPDSKYPLYELTIDEIIKLIYYIDERLDKTFDQKILNKLRGVKIKAIPDILDKKKAIEDSKIVKAAKKTRLGVITKVIKGALSNVNPIKWINKAAVPMILNKIFNTISDAVIDIIGTETAKVYSKNIFKVEDNDIDINDDILNDYEEEEN